MILMGPFIGRVRQREGLAFPDDCLIGRTDDSGNVVEGIGYDSFGNNGGSARARYGYTRRERDPDTGVLYYRARFYDPQLGSFISEDPLGFEAEDVNLYAYVGNDPPTYTDASGLERLNYTILPGQPAPPIITNPVRLPDFFSVLINLAIE